MQEEVEEGLEEVEGGLAEAASFQEEREEEMGEMGEMGETGETSEEEAARRSGEVGSGEEVVEEAGEETGGEETVEEAGEEAETEEGTERAKAGLQHMPWEWRVANQGRWRAGQGKPSNSKKEKRKASAMAAIVTYLEAPGAQTPAGM